MNIFIAEFLPLANRGEEAILRGIADMFGGDSTVNFGIMGNQKDISIEGNVTIFPVNWLYPSTERKHLSRITQRILFLYRIIICRQGALGRQANIYSGGSEYQPMHKFFHESDLVIVGHDGIFSLESCGVIFASKRLGKRTGVLGAGISRSRRYVGLYGPVYRKAIARADFCYLREQGSYELMKSICRDEKKVKLSPDPAFAMEPEKRQYILDLLRKYAWFKEARQHDKAIVFVTVCQKSIIYDESFLGLSGQEKIRAHINFVAALLRFLIVERNAITIFLPHTVDTGSESDISVARSISNVLYSVRSSVVIIDEALTARELKGLIREADFLVAERTHSMIASVDVATPFVALTNSKDLRTHDIIGKMAGCEESIINMDYPDMSMGIQKTLNAFDQREYTRRVLKENAVNIRVQLAAVAADVAGAI